MHMALTRLSFLILALAMALACRETRSISSGEFEDLKKGRDFQVSDAEVERMLAVITARIERGEDISGSMSKLIQLAISKKGPDYPWRGLTLSGGLLQRITAKRDFYRGIYRGALDSYGFVPGCDGLLFTSLLVASGLDHNLFQAESLTQPGKWHRNATQDCLQTGQSVSTISRDMLLGLSLALWKKRDAGSVQRLLSYSASRSGRLGEAINAQEQAGRATMSPSLLTLLTEINFKISNEDSEFRGYFPETLAPLRGFESHLQVLRLLLKGSLYGGLIKTDFQVLEKLALSQPKNALFQAIYHGYLDGDGTTAATVLLNPQYFPEQSLPSTKQRCEPYIWQRDQDTSDWVPCPDKNETFPAADYFWVAALLANEWTTP